MLQTEKLQRLIGPHNFEILYLPLAHMLSQSNRKLFLTVISFCLGSNFLCATHIIPVKNEEGVVMMFILNFDYILDEGSSDSLERLNHTSPSKADQCE